MKIFSSMDVKAVFRSYYFFLIWQEQKADHWIHAFMSSNKKKKENLKLIVRRISKRSALDSIKSWTHDSVDYRTFRFRCCCNAVDPSEIRRRRRQNCQEERRSDLDWWLPIRTCPCINRRRRIPSHCRAADSSSRSTWRSF